MNAELLLTHFNRMSEAPGAIPCLRRFIIDLAVRGKLVEQDADEEPAAQLLRKIQVEKARLVREGKIRKQNIQPDVERKSIPFAIPKNWIWTRLGDVIHLVSGQHLQPGEYSEDKEDGLPYITGPADFGQNGLVITRRAIVRKAVATKGQILLTVKGAGVGKTALCDLPEVAISRQLMAMTAIEWSQKFLLLTTHRLAAVLIESARSLIPGISREDVDEFIFPLPPLPEQHRIVVKVDKLMALCDRLEATQRERETRRNRLTAASHYHLNNGADAVALRNHAHFFIGHLPRLTTYPEQIKQLRQTILNLAVRGQLGSQDPSDKSVSELLARIRAEKIRLIGEHALERELSQVCLTKDDLPFDLPSTWQWEPLQRVIVFGPQNGISPKPSSRPGAPKAITLTATTKGTFDAHFFKQVDATIPRQSEFWLRSGDLLFQRGNTREYVRMAAYYTGEPGVFLYPDLMMKVRLSEEVSLRYIHLCAVAPHARNYFSSHASGAQSTMPKINQGILVRLPIPLPPFAEQLRIVAKVDELMALCDRLETQLTTAQTQASRLLESVLHNALSDDTPPQELEKSAALK